jgi:septum formation protein
MTDRKIILASGSPRRRELIEAMGLRFGVGERYEVEERYPTDLAPERVAAWLAELKSEAYPHAPAPDDLLLTADTVVILDGAIMGKPRDAEQAAAMLGSLSGRTHEVITGVCLRSADGRRRVFSDTTRVTFRTLNDDEIARYVASGAPMDKAGAYGIQEWIGLIGVSAIEGSYTNVVGLPTEKLYAELKRK